ncbi:MAG: T9SS type A sorting domain-containing protein [Bacteroidota bacterium]
MKKFTFIIALCAFTTFAFAQNVITPKSFSKTTVATRAANQDKTPTDTIFLNEFFGAGQAVNIGSTGGGYVFGTNVGAGAPGSPACAQGYFMLTSGYGIEEVLIWVAGKEKTSTNGSSITVSVNAIDDSSFYGPSGAAGYAIACPGTVKGSVVVPWASIDTTAANFFTIAHFATPIYVNTDYAVVADVSNMYTNGDTVGFVASADGGASSINGLEYTWWMYPATTPFWTQASHVYTAFDNAIAFWPVVDANYIGMNDNFAHGIKLSCTPNPVKADASIQYAIENNSNVTVEVYNTQGQKVLSFNEGNKTAGQYEVKFNAEKLATGTYYYSVKANENRMTKKMIVE